MNWKVLVHIIAWKEFRFSRGSYSVLKLETKNQKSTYRQISIQERSGSWNIRERVTFGYILKCSWKNKSTHAEILKNKQREREREKPEMYRSIGSKEDSSLAHIYFSVKPINQSFDWSSICSFNTHLHPYFLPFLEVTTPNK